jgi:Ran GTPase-activating protein (RanGAP) involved in mRNA processing and transport
MVAICSTLENDKHIEKVLISGNILGMEGGLAVAKMMQNNTVIEVLKMANTE